MEREGSGKEDLGTEHIYVPGINMEHKYAPYWSIFMLQYVKIHIFTKGGHIIRGAASERT